MCQRRPADPTDPGDAADLNHGVAFGSTPAIYPRAGSVTVCTFAQRFMKINNFLTKSANHLH
ncbi:hypothetical protein EJ066_22280 [Mesorhizobium sp. M9A.F.Ca.ET.002.03.1.2]|nr:hypothetical protein EJ066_22280 [Mesorhizobium sp. M9A.F.Ca.ET.002.03.1.2]